MLARPIGHDCAGAVRFARPDDVDELLARPGEVEWLTDDDVAQRLRELREDATAWLGREFTGHWVGAGLTRAPPTPDDQRSRAGRASQDTRGDPPE